MIDGNRSGERLPLGRRSGLHLPESEILEDLLNDLLILYKTDDLHPSLALGTGQGVHFKNVTLKTPGIYLGCLIFSLKSKSISVPGVF